MAQAALESAEFSLAFAVWIAFIMFLRPCEIIYRTFSDFTLTDNNTAMIIELGYTKGGKRRNVKERVVCRDASAILMFVWLSEGRNSDSYVYPEGMPHFRRRFGDLLIDIHLKDLPYKPYSLRRGGATHAFLLSKSYGPVMDTGRWMALRTCKIYIDEARVLLSNRVLSDKAQEVIRSKAEHFQRMFGA